jgi:uncharacterized YigZ family protein
LSNFFTIKNTAESLFKDKGSKFIGYAFRVDSEEEIKNQLQKLRKEYYDATHHCYAWILGADKKNYRANDDGEPNHSAGDPILGAIKSKDLTNILIVVVRYYGGTNLGVGGLINAYRTSAAMALENAEIVEDYIYLSKKIQFDYLSMNEVMSILKHSDTSITSQNFGNNCELTFKIKEQNAVTCVDKLKKINNLHFITEE